MPQLQRLTCRASDAEGVTTDSIVVCGPVGAVWRVLTRADEGDQVQLMLEPFSPHDVPLNARPPELPMPRAAA